MRGSFGMFLQVLPELSVRGVATSVAFLHNSSVSKCPLLPFVSGLLPIRRYLPFLTLSSVHLFLG